MADSLFDNRYRYDFIYPRGRSGETLRAVDTHDNDRPVVIKRPAPQDAPPIRMGQEVSILNERKALTRLAGHSVATALVGGGQFTVGGMAHQYIVMERAEGQTVADLISEYQQRDERLPELEMLVIVDHLLDLLAAAHGRDVVYNDVDAKHLFWNRETHRLKVIDWGNAVFLEGDDVTAQGISRLTDIYQIGELLFSIVTGGARLEMQRESNEEFRVDFGRDGDRLHSRLVAIISRAAHPNPRLRYTSVAELRKELTEYRLPLERERASVISRVNERLRYELSRDELNGLLSALDPALASDPGYPPGRTAQQAILDRQTEIAVSADLDAARIYMDSGSWVRAVDVLEGLRGRARGDLAATIGLQLDWARLLMGSAVDPTPTAVFDAIGFVFEETPEQAATHLLTTLPTAEEARAIHLLLAERISAHYPEIMLLRPNLYRLQVALDHLASEGIGVSEAQVFLRDIHRELDHLAVTRSAVLTELRDGFRKVVDQMNALKTFLGTVRAKHQLSNQRLPLTALERAANAVMALADDMHVIGKQAVSSPRDARAALTHSRGVAPGFALWDVVDRLLGALYDALAAAQTYTPAADGSDISGWLKATRDDLTPFVERLFDEMLVGMALGLERAGDTWAIYAETVVQGNRVAAITALAEATDAVSTIAPPLAGWFNHLRSTVNNAAYIERHALYGGLGRALADGWEMFDHGRAADAERLGQQAFEIARSDTERAAARRLRDLAMATREWIDRGVGDRARTEAALTQVELLYTADEIAARDQFAAQMPTRDTFLKAMHKGLVDGFDRASSAAARILFMNYVLLGALDADEDRLDDASFWHQAARITLTRGGDHPAAQALVDSIQRRRDLRAAADLLNSLNGSHALPTLEGARSALEANPQARALAPAIYSLREVEAAARDWSDGEFRAAGNKFENAVRALDEVEANSAITLTGYRSWLLHLLEAAANLHNGSRRLTQIIEARIDTPDPALLSLQRDQVRVTEASLGVTYAATLRLWLETYEKFLAVYTDTDARRSARLSRFNDLFRAMFIDRHPAYPLYRHWYDLTEGMPEFPAPPTDEPTPRLTDADDLMPFVRVETPDDDEEDETIPTRRRRSPLMAILGVVLVLAIAIGGGLFALGVFDDGSGSLGDAGIGIATATEDVSAVLADVSPTSLRSISPTARQPEADVVIVPTASSTLTPSPTVTATITPEPTDPPTQTPTATPTATLTRTPSATPTVTSTPLPTLPPDGLRGDQNVLAGIAGLVAIDAAPWEVEEFSEGIDRPDYWRLGVGIGTGGEVRIALTPDLLDQLYGNDAAARLIDVSAELDLATFNPPLLIDQQVFYGMLVAPEGGEPVGIQLQLVEAGVYNFAVRRGDSVTVIRQRSVSGAIRLRMVRDINAGTIAFFVNDDVIGDPVRLPRDARLTPILFARRGGVIVQVNRWRMTLR